MKRILVYLLVILSIFILNYPGSAFPESNLRATGEVTGITQAAHLRPTLKYSAEFAEFNALEGEDISFVMFFPDRFLYFENPSTREVTFIDPYLITQFEIIYLSLLPQVVAG